MKELNSLIRDTAMVVSNTEYVLGKPCIVSEDFRASFLNGIILGNDLDDRDAEYRLMKIVYNDLGNYIVIVGCVYGLEKVGLEDIDVEFIDRGVYYEGDKSWVDKKEADIISGISFEDWSDPLVEYVRKQEAKDFNNFFRKEKESEWQDFKKGLKVSYPGKDNMDMDDFKEGIDALRKHGEYFLSEKPIFPLHSKSKKRKENK